MSNLKTLLVAPKQSYVNALRLAMGDVHPPRTVQKVAGVGAIKVYGGGAFGIIAMQVKGDYKKMCDRMEKAWQKIPSLSRMAVVLPGFTEEWMRVNNYQVRFTMYLLNDVDSLVQFINNRALFTRPSSLDAIFQVRPPKAKRQKKTPPLPAGGAIIQREIAPEEAEREEDACAVCFEHKITHMCIPCSHFVLCGVCAAQVKEDKAICPVCRAPIESYATPIGK